MAARYRLDPTRSRFTVQAFATGMLSVFGHSPTFAVGRYTGELRSETGDIHDMTLELTVDAGSLEVIDQVSPGDRQDMQERLRRDVLETEAYPEIVYRAPRVAVEPAGQGAYRARFAGRLSLHGVTNDQPVPAELRLFADGLHLTGECLLCLSDYRIKPVTALGGSIRLKDEVKVSYDIAGFPEGS